MARGRTMKVTKEADIRLTQLSEIDDALVADVFDSCWADTEPSVMMHSAHGYKRVSRWLDIEPKASAMAWSGDKPAGVVLLGLRDPARAYVASIAVEPEFRGRGIGRRLMQWSTARARIFGASRIGLHVFEENLIAQSLYRSLGYSFVRRIGHWEGIVATPATGGLEFRYADIEEAIKLAGEPDMPALWENEPRSIANMSDSNVCAIGYKKDEPFGYVVYSTRSLCWILDLKAPFGTDVKDAADLVYNVPAAGFAPTVFTTVPEGGETERLVRTMGLRLERTRLEMEIRLSQDTVA